jgi:fatty acid-binding protein DegV
MAVGKKYRGKYEKCLASYVQDRLANCDDLDMSMPLFITQTKVSDVCYAAVKEAVANCSSFDTVYETTAGCTISCHCGPGTLGVLFVHK